MIEKHAAEGHPVRNLCEIYDVSASGYYDWLNREPSKREQENENIMTEIKEIYKTSSDTYGSPRITTELHKKKIKVSKNRVARLMVKNGIKSKQKASYKPRTTDSNHDMPISPNLLPEITCSHINQVLVGDITYIPTKEGWEYLAAFMDYKSRMIKGWCMREHMRTELVVNAFHKAVFRHKLPEELIVHTDRGSQYASNEFRGILKGYKAISSMSRKGNCYDNATMESFWATLKKDLKIIKPFKTREEARIIVFKYIETFYNRFRIHTSIGNMSPYEYELKFKSSCSLDDRNRSYT